MRRFQIVVLAALAATPGLAQDAGAPPASTPAPAVVAAAEAQAPLNAIETPPQVPDAPAAADLAADPPDAAAAPPAAAAPSGEPAREPAAAKPETADSAKAAKPADSKERRCTADGRSCITVASYVADVCSTIERAAGENRLDPNFLARLLWKESLFEPEAVSPAGALGIAQFMPDTARLRKLDDPFNPAKAIHASADYLRYLIDGFGNMGLAAVAYNGGERRAETFFKGGNVLPFETQDYVESITGHNAWKWRDEPPAQIDLRLDRDKPFGEACVQLAANRKLKEFSSPQRSYPWGVILASHPKQSGAQQQVNRLNRQLRPILGGKKITFVRKTMTGSGKRVYTAQVGYASRGEANAFCSQFRAVGGRCIVLKN